MVRQAFIAAAGGAVKRTHCAWTGQFRFWTLAFYTWTGNKQVANFEICLIFFGPWEMPKKKFQVVVSQNVL